MTISRLSLFCIKESLSSREVVDILCKKMNILSKETGIITGLILCTLRHYSESQSMETVKLVNEFYDKGVVGFDIAADEAGFPLDNHISAFEYAHQYKLNCTAHAGEAMGAESVWETINKLKTKRIGHGVRSIEDDELIDFLLDNNHHLEVCPTSNIKTKTFESLEQHPIDKLFKRNISLSINSDGRTISNVNLNKEYHKLSDLFGWSLQQLNQKSRQKLKQKIKLI
jgi:adenosine deaminase